MPFVRQASIGLLGAAAFGVAAGLLKGDQVGLRGQIANLSAPWLLVAFLPTLCCRSVVRGALTGLAGTLLALGGFYVTLTVVLMGHLSEGGYLDDLVVEFGANRIYLLGGMVSGPLFGALGAWIGHRHRHFAWLVVGGLVTGEILVVALVQGHQLMPSPLYFTWGVDDWTAYLAELACGVAIVAVALWRRPWQAAVFTRREER